MSQPEQPAPFVDNWAYLKTELNWLDRMLMMAVSRQKRELREVDDFATSIEDRVTSHWWKGIIAINRSAGYDNVQPPKSTKGRSGSYVQQLEARIQASRQQGIVLALPCLKEQLQLSQFEKNVILMALAPEINQRFGRIYSYLQYQHDESDWDLPTVNLCLRLLCRNDQEWRRSRPLVTSSSRLLELGILEWVNSDDTTLLSRHLRVTEDLSGFLLAETPDPTLVGSLLDTASGDQGGGMTYQATPEDTWESLILPTPQLTQMATIASIAAVAGQAHPLVLFHGEAGTGKTKATKVLAAKLNLPLITLDAGHLSAAGVESLFEALDTIPPCVFVLEAAQHWLGRKSVFDPPMVRQLISHIRETHGDLPENPQPGLVILTSHYLQAIRPSWRQQLDAIVEFPHPDESARKALWQQAIPHDLSKDRHLSWTQLARQLPLTGGDIMTLAQTAVGLALQSDPPTLTAGNIQQALALHHPSQTFKMSKSKTPKR
jgi:hypothetical protein